MTGKKVVPRLAESCRFDQEKPRGKCPRKGRSSYKNGYLRESCPILMI
jgi:hypothetical protein